MLISYLVQHFCCCKGTVLEDTKTGGKNGFLTFKLEIIIYIYNFSLHRYGMAAVLETKRSSVTIVKELKQAIGLISNIKLYNTDADLMLVHQTLFVKYLISL